MPDPDQAQQNFMHNLGPNWLDTYGRDPDKTPYSAEYDLVKCCQLVVFANRMTQIRLDKTLEVIWTP